jgi:hypothetical protein
MGFLRAIRQQKHAELWIKFNHSRQSLQPTYASKNAPIIRDYVDQLAVEHIGYQ